MEIVKINIYDSKKHDIQYFEKFNDDNYQLNFLEYRLSQDMNIDRFKKDLKGANAIVVFVNDDVNKDVIDALVENNIRLICTRSAGVNHIDLDYAKSKEITIANVPTYSPHSVAEHALALLLTINRKTHRAYLKGKMNDFTLDGLIGKDLYGQTVGVVGFGQIGAIFSNIIKGLGCDVLVHSVPDDQERIEKNGFQFVSLDTLLKKADVISLHVPLTPDTKELINRDTIKKMKKGVTLINTSRGGLINSSDLIDGLRSETIAFAGLDVYSNEQRYFFEDKSSGNINDPILMQLLQSNRVLITPHSGFFTENALTKIAQTTFSNLHHFFDNKQ